MNKKDITKVGPVDMQYIWPWGLGITLGKTVMTSEITYKNNLISNNYKTKLSVKEVGKYLQTLLVSSKICYIWLIHSIFYPQGQNLKLKSSKLFKIHIVHRLIPTCDLKLKFRGIG